MSHILRDPEPFKIFIHRIREYTPSSLPLGFPSPSPVLALVAQAFLGSSSQKDGGAFSHSVHFPCRIQTLQPKPNFGAHPWGEKMTPCLLPLQLSTSHCTRPAFICPSKFSGLDFSPPGSIVVTSGRIGLEGSYTTTQKWSPRSVLVSLLFLSLLSLEPEQGFSIQVTMVPSASSWKYMKDFQETKKVGRLGMALGESAKVSKFSEASQNKCFES